MQPDFRTPLKRAIGLGSAKEGTGHFMWQRITAIALALCGLYLIGLLFGIAGAEYPIARAIVADPLNAMILIAFLVAAFWHAKLGLQVIIEDYVHTPLLGGIAHLANIFVCALAAIAGVLAIVRIALGS
ncbi:succinate dehydrogenase, hydrophobic membrane anchor protein [Thermomonas sp. HDW16]|uniref:succinate dehydrogenase, hydrophobic membrane anchor protein n=1 Tax=Thermomonas sp. HDW16 TaxID=2714945 RepID=UPI00140CCCEE|nr:succinate dehydrogenase, hydrophobic membrane anchor protein [Thermomonas sp. HDW16]QIL21733.1 succinate dehydrogenase, hydrophobic membrane anchor protein [Thermomonas sp. HDW16]